MMTFKQEAFREGASPFNPRGLGPARRRAAIRAQYQPTPPWPLLAASGARTPASGLVKDRLSQEKVYETVTE